MMPPEYHRERYNTLRSLNICVACGTENATPGKVKCKDCSIKSANRMKKYRQDVKYSKMSNK